MRSSSPFSLVGLLLVTFMLSSVGCDSDSSTDETHPDPARVQIESAGTALANASEINSAGNLIVAEGVEYSVEAVFLNEDGTLFDHGSNEFLEVQVENESVARWVVDSPGSFSGKLQGLSEGTTSIVFRLMHGTVGSSSAHADFVSRPIEVVVTQ